MTFIEAPTNFYIGRTVDPATGKLSPDEVVYYDSRDLTTHGIVLGMTGSGKTGLCIDILEEAVMDGIPAILIDPKGDIGNLLLAFPELSPQQFAPWIDPDEAQRSGMTIDEMAAKKAQEWRDGLAGWGINTGRIQVLKNAADYTIYTPGSDSGIPISILSSLKAPRGGFEGNEEAVQETISSVVSAILAMAGVKAEPVKDREHVLLSNIFENSWRQGKDLTLEDIIMQVQEPPFDKLGALSVNQYFPAKDRGSLAMSLNSVVAAPSFKSWLRGVPLDVQSMLYTPEGKPRISIFYIAHLNDTERMFVMTLLLETVINWMRNQPGTSSLRALLYIDEIFGFFPPIANPPSKQPMLRLLKQARAFGLGLLLATQNPVDVDYKGLSNIGTWFIGRMQSERDTDRVIAGVKEAAATSDMDLSEVRQLIAQIKSRTFLMRNVHDKGQTTLFSSRWAMSYLAGPFTRQQISQLMDAKRQALAATYLNMPTSTATRTATSNSVPVGGGGVGVATAVPIAPAAAPSTPASASDLPRGYSTTVPAAGGADKFFLPTTVRPADAIRTWEQNFRARADSYDNVRLAYQPILIAQGSILYNDAKSGTRAVKDFAYHVTDVPTSGFVDWERFAAKPIDRRNLESNAPPNAIFAELPVGMADAKRLKGLENDLENMLYQSSGVMKVPFNTTAKVYGRPEDQPGEFESRVNAAIRELRDDEVDKVTKAAESKLNALDDRLERKQREQDRAQETADRRQRDQIMDLAGGVLGMFGGGRSRTATSLSRIGRAATRGIGSRDGVREVQDDIEGIQQQMQDLKTELQRQLDEVDAKWEQVAKDNTEYEIRPLKKDIQVETFGIGWVPFYAFTANGRTEYAQAFA